MALFCTPNDKLLGKYMQQNTSFVRISTVQHSQCYIKFSYLLKKNFIQI